MVKKNLDSITRSLSIWNLKIPRHRYDSASDYTSKPGSGDELSPMLIDPEGGGGSGESASLSRPYDSYDNSLEYTEEMTENHEAKYIGGNSQRYKEFIEKGPMRRDM